MKQSSTQTKQDQYMALVNQFKNHKFCDKKWLNPFDIKDNKFDFETYQCLNPWNLWHGNLDARILLIGQDWGSEKNFKENFQGNWQKEIKAPTNIYLKRLFEILDYNIGLPDPNNQNNFPELPLFFTNAILGIREGENNGRGNMDLSAYKDTTLFLLVLISIIQPKYIIAMGGWAYKAIHHLYNDVYPKKFPPATSLVKNLIENNGKYPPICGAELFVVYHPSGKPKNLQPLEFDKLQKDSWANIKKMLSDNQINS